jgi:hypothetical protein
MRLSLWLRVRRKEGKEVMAASHDDVDEIKEKKKYYSDVLLFRCFNNDHID